MDGRADPPGEVNSAENVRCKQRMLTSIVPVNTELDPR